MGAAKSPATSDTPAATSDTAADSGAAAEKPADMPPATSPATPPATQPAASHAAEKEKPKPEEKPAEPAPAPPAPAPPAVINLQVNVFSSPEAAEPVASLLRHKNYPVTVVPGTTDHYFHVLVGPFSTMKEADAMKKTLEGEGFKPIVKK